MDLKTLNDFQNDKVVDKLVRTIGDIRHDTHNIFEGYAFRNAKLTRLMPFLTADIILTTVVLALVVAQFFTK